MTNRQCNQSSGSARGEQQDHNAIKLQEEGNIQMLKALIPAANGKSIYQATINPVGWLELIATSDPEVNDKIINSDPYLCTHVNNDLWPANSGPFVTMPAFPGAGFVPLGPYYGIVPSINGRISVTPETVRDDRSYTKANGAILEINDALLTSWICPADLNDCGCWWDFCNGYLGCNRPYRICKQLRKWNGYRCPGMEFCPYIHNIQPSCRFISSQHHAKGWPAPEEKVCKMVLHKGNECTAGHDLESARQASYDALTNHKNTAPPGRRNPYNFPGVTGGGISGVHDLNALRDFTRDARGHGYFNRLEGLLSSSYRSALYFTHIRQFQKYLQHYPRPSYGQDRYLGRQTAQPQAFRAKTLSTIPAREVETVQGGASVFGIQNDGHVMMASPATISNRSSSSGSEIGNRCPHVFGLNPNAPSFSRDSSLETTPAYNSSDNDQGDGKKPDIIHAAV